MIRRFVLRRRHGSCRESWGNGAWTLLIRADAWARRLNQSLQNILKKASWLGRCRIRVLWCRWWSRERHSLGCSRVYRSFCGWVVRIFWVWSAYDKLDDEHLRWSSKTRLDQSGFMCPKINAWYEHASQNCKTSTALFGAWLLCCNHWYTCTNITRFRNDAHVQHLLQKVDSTRSAWFLKKTILSPPFWSGRRPFLVWKEVDIWFFCCRRNTPKCWSFPLNFDRKLQHGLKT